MFLQPALDLSETGVPSDVHPRCRRHPEDAIREEGKILQQDSGQVRTRYLHGLCPVGTKPNQRNIISQKTDENTAAPHSCCYHRHFGSCIAVMVVFHHAGPAHRWIVAALLRQIPAVRKDP